MNTHENNNKLYYSSQGFIISKFTDDELKKLFAKSKGQNKHYKYQWFNVGLATDIYNEIKKSIRKSKFWDEIDTAMIERLFELCREEDSYNDRHYKKIVKRCGLRSGYDILIIRKSEVWWL